MRETTITDFLSGNDSLVDSYCWRSESMKYMKTIFPLAVVLEKESQDLEKNNSLGK